MNLGGWEDLVLGRESREGLFRQRKPRADVRRVRCFSSTQPIGHHPRGQIRGPALSVVDCELLSGGEVPLNLTLLSPSFSPTSFSHLHFPLLLTSKTLFRLLSLPRTPLLRARVPEALASLPPAATVIVSTCTVWIFLNVSPQLLISCCSSDVKRHLSVHSPLVVSFFVCLLHACRCPSLWRN